jgi:hypothetical protein
VTGLPPDPTRLRVGLAGSLADITRLFAQRETVIRDAWTAGIPLSDIERLVGSPTGRSVGEIVKEHEKQREEASFAATADLWKWGAVIEDRYGLRWRADLREHVGRGWGCRSVGLRTWLTGEQMAKRGPLKSIRLDRVFAGDEAKIARDLGAAEDAAVTVAPAEDPEWIPVQFPVLLVEGLTTTDGRIIDGGGVTVGDLPISLLIKQEGLITEPVGRIDTLNRTVGIARRRDGRPFPPGVAVWSGSGAIHGFTPDEVTDMTRRLFPEPCLSDVELDESTVDGFTRITSGVLRSVHLGEHPAFEDAYWTLPLPGSS